MTDLDFDVALEEGAVRPGSHHAQLASADAEAARALAAAVLRQLPVGAAEGEDDAAWGALGLIDQAEESLDMPGGDFDVPAITAAEMLEDDAYGAEVWVPTAPQTVVAPRSRTWIWGVVATLLIGVGVFAAFLAMPDDDAGERFLTPASAPSAASASAPGAAAPATTAAAAAPATSAGDAPPSAAPASLASDNAAPQSAAPESVAAAPKATRATRRPTRRAPAAKPAPVAAAPETAGPTRSAPRPKKATAEVDDLLGGLNGGGKPAAKRPAAAVLDDPALPVKLSKAQILRVVRTNASKISGCKRAGATGTVKVAMVIGRDGRVTSATPGGSFAGTPAGVCVAAKVRAFRFPQFSGDPMRINMPFRL